MVRVVSLARAQAWEGAYADHERRRHYSVLFARERDPGRTRAGDHAETDRTTTFPYETVNDPAAQIDGGAEATGHLSQSDPETDERVVAFLRPRLSAS
jgi:hypothetical protein